MKGLQMHLGEVRGLSMLRKRFLRLPEEFNRKILSGLHPAVDSPKSDKQPSVGDQENLRARLLQVAEPGPAEPASANKRDSGRNVAAKRGDRWKYFAMCWNEIVKSFREDDLLSNREMDLLRFRFAEGVGGLDVYLPVFLSAGMLDKVISQTRVYRGRWSDRWKAVSGKEAEKEAELKLQTDELYQRVMSSTLMYEALQEIWETVAWILDSLLGEQHRESVRKIIALTHRYVKRKEIFNRFKIDKDPSQDQASALKDSIVGVVKALRDSISNMATPNTKESGNRRGSAATRRTSAISAVPEDSDNLIESSPTHQRDINLICEKVRNMFMVLSSFFNAKDEEVLVELEKVHLSPLGFFWNDQYVSEQLKILRDDPRTEAVLDRAEHLMTATKVDAEPHNETAKRRLRFFVNSLFMDLPLAAPTMDMWSFTTLTPFYSEDIIFSLPELNRTNEDGVSVLFYLKVLYPDEWRNFLERVMPGKSDKDFTDACAGDPKKKLQMRLWASYRGQTLSRTVRGMMLYEKALKVLMAFEHPNKQQVEELVKLKFNYTVSCQIYGDQKKKRQPKAEDTELLLRQYPNLRVAYIDEVKGLTAQGEKTEYFSVLIKHDAAAGQPVEVYRVKLPGRPLLGEGKPENQNHAIVFTRGELLQAIDMNQDSYLEEAFKIVNLLQEFKADGSGSSRPFTIVGFREHIFTEGLSSLAKFMAVQENTFVTLGQRALQWPLGVRMHYGHPDFFDKLWTCTRGGISKASKDTNLNEDIFAGFNHTLRGGRVQYSEYTQVGKGRDVGLMQITIFEKKLAQGAGEQVVSRDIHRLTNSFDFWRLQGFYYGGVGFYMSTYLTVMAIYVYVYARLAMALIKLEHRVPTNVLSLVNTEWILQLGFLTSLPMLVTIGLEHGFRNALMELLHMTVTGSTFFFVFLMGTKVHFFDQTLMIGDTKYLATGRGFVMRHETFDEIYRFYAVSHFYKGMELVAVLIVYGMALPRDLAMFADQSQNKSFNYWLLTWSVWVVAITWVFAPFWFNPLGFHWGKTLKDFDEWRKWMKREDDSATRSWRQWWEEENKVYSRLSIWQRATLVFQQLRWFIVAFGMFYNIAQDINDRTEPLKRVTNSQIAAQVAIAYFGATVLIVSFGVLAFLVYRIMSTRHHRTFRVMKMLAFALIFAAYCPHSPPPARVCSARNKQGHMLQRGRRVRTDRASLCCGERVRRATLSWAAT
jgi:callose synthase